MLPNIRKMQMPLYSFFAYKMTVASENSMLKHRNVDLNTVSLKTSEYEKNNK
jgi:hypothetical protein